jgi:hypothetical protein
MPIAALIYNLEEEQEAHDCAVRGHQFKSALIDIHEQIRQHNKHADSDVESFDVLIEKIRRIVIDCHCLV